ncbi:hypothetical protein BKA69DRAFT_1128002 [Paraphysoderma sedebokerense]|nr:hypothetical protein BKA69DRAFT_1128002 [Paraphysoderma sedebokerense]
MTFSFDATNQTSFFGNAAFRPPPPLPQQPFSVDYRSNSFMSTNTAGFSFNSASTMNNSMSKEPASQPHHQAPSFSFGNRPNSLSNQYANFSFGNDPSTRSTLNSFTFGNASISPTNQGTFSFNLPSSSQQLSTFSFNPSPLTNSLASAEPFSFGSSSSAHFRTTETSIPLQPNAEREKLESFLIAKHYVKAQSATDQYNNYSFEELRLKDYQTNRKSCSVFTSAFAMNTPPLVSQGTASLSSQHNSLPANNSTSASQYSPYREILVDSENHTRITLSYFSLSADPHFCNYSSEELRWMDYQGLQGSKRTNATELNTTVKIDHVSLPTFSFGDRTSTGQIGAEVRDTGGPSTSTLQNRNNGTDNPRSIASTVRLNRAEVPVNTNDTLSNRAGVSHITRQTTTDTESRSRPRQHENRNGSIGDRNNYRQPSNRYRSERSVQPSQLTPDGPVVQRRTVPEQTQ